MTSPATPTAAYMVPRGLLPSGRALADLTFCSGIRFHGRPAACETMMNGRGSRGAVVVLRSAVKGALIPILSLTSGSPLAPFGWSGSRRLFP